MPRCARSETFVENSVGWTIEASAADSNNLARVAASRPVRLRILGSIVSTHEASVFIWDVSAELKLMTLPPANFAMSGPYLHLTLGTMTC